MLRLSNLVQQFFGQNRFARRTAFSLLHWIEKGFLGRHKDIATLELISRIRNEREALLTASDAYALYSIARAQLKHSGEWAEVGVFEGASAKLLCEAKGERRLHLFDTFTGLPDPDMPERSILKKHQFRADEQSVRQYLAPYPNVTFHVGLFPETGSAINDLRFSLVHLDVDLYRSTLDCLEFFYPRMIPGGIIVSHDYTILAGVKAAVDNFFDDKPEGVLDLPSTQCVIIRSVL
ncbi:MAG: tylF 2 [Planctomycetaceae bacterium]|nr:tylF 2 [Planctomycetaceae bacterium]